MSSKTHGFGFLQKLKDFLIRVRIFKVASKDFLFGATTYNMVKSLEQRMLLEEYALMLVVLGDIFGYQISSYYQIRLFPFWIPKLEAWTHYMLRRKDITEKFE